MPCSDKDLQVVRRKNLKTYIAENYTSLAEFTLAHNLYSSNISNILNGKRSFSGKLAKELEEKLKLSKDFFNSPVKNKTKPILFLKLENSELVEINEFLELEKEPWMDEFDLFALKEHTKINKDGLADSINNNHAVLVFDKQQIIPQDTKYYLFKFYDSYFIRKCKFNQDHFLFITDFSEFTPIRYFAAEISIVAKLVCAYNRTDYF
jgi:hypothetical protein